VVEDAQHNGEVIEISREEEKQHLRPCRNGIRLLNLKEVMALPTPKCLVSELVVAAGLAILVGKPESAKTFLALAWSLCIASGSPWLGRDVLAGPVVYVAAEGLRGLARRVKAWIKKTAGVDESMLEQNFYAIGSAVRLLDDDEFADLMAVLRRLSPAPILVVIDTLARCMPGGDENLAADMGLLVDRCAQIQQELGAAVILVHHSRKDDDEPRGSSALSGAVDTWIAVSKKGREIKVCCEKQKDADAFEDIHLDLVQVAVGEDGDGQPETSCVLRLAEAGQPHSSRVRVRENMKESESQILAALRAGWGASAVALLELREKCTLKKSTFYKEVERLVQKGLLDRTTSEGTDFVRLIRLDHDVLVSSLSPVSSESLETPAIPVPQSLSPTSLEGRGTETGTGSGPGTPETADLLELLGATYD
jgi:hypothetical protein